MNTSIAPCLEKLSKMSIQEVANLPDHRFSALVEEYEHEERKLERIFLLLDKAIEQKYHDEIEQAYLAKGEPHGAVCIVAETMTLTVNKPLCLEWDEDMLKALGECLLDSGENPYEYIECDRYILRKNLLKMNNGVINIRSNLGRFVEASLYLSEKNLQPGPLRLKSASYLP